VPATIRDVAEAAGVSTATVSRTYGRPDKVDEGTRARVLDAARRLGFQPSGAARTLKTGRTGAIGVVVPDLSNPFFPDVVRGVQHEAHEHSYPLLLADSEEDPAAELPLARTLARNVDALVLCSPRASDADLAEAAALRPVVLINREPAGWPGTSVPPVAIDNADGMRQAVRHLRALGHRRIGFVAGPGTSSSVAARLAAFRAATADAGAEGAVVGGYEPTLEGGARAADDVLVAGVSGVVVYNDIMAAGLLGRLARFGVDVPGRVSVVGFDDIAVSALLTPALTTVRIPRAEAGRRAVRRLHAALTGADPAAVAPGPLPTELVVRASTGPAPRG
jgi:LacI family transcriptional regulator/LacI family repressor for deo operon, udp, cdd, tsx, nupC, and nupG